MAAQSRAIPVILTRPAEQGARFAKNVRDRFGSAVAVIESPLLAPLFLQPLIPPERWTAVIFTSATAVAALGHFGRVAAALPKKAYCVGDRTAEAARAMGFDANSAQGNAAALCALIRDAHETGPLLHLRGEEALGDIAKELNLAGIETHEAIAYREVAQTLTAQACTVLSSDRPVILPVFSPRTGTILAHELATFPRLAPLVMVSISPATARPLDDVKSRYRFVADHPDAPSMLTAIGQAMIAAQAT
jgi:uroporphyrinogen-III synthase